MKLLILIILFTILVSPMQVMKTPIAYANSAQKFCNSLIPEQKYRSLTAALVCGENEISSQQRNLLIKSSLYHLVVVSAAHLATLTLMLQALTGIFVSGGKKQAFLVWIVAFALPVYALMTGLQAPIFRALIAYFLSIFSQQLRLAWPTTWIQILATLGCLIVVPEWIHSLSLILSSLASMALVIGKTRNQDEHFSSALKTQLIIYLTLLFPLSSMNGSHPSSIFFNLIFAPFLGLVLLPLAVLSMAIPLLTPIYDVLLTWMFQLLHLSTNSIGGSVSPLTLSYKFYWLEWVAISLLATWQMRRQPRCKF